MKNENKDSVNIEESDKISTVFDTYFMQVENGNDNITSGFWNVMFGDNVSRLIGINFYNALNILDKNQNIFIGHIVFLHFCLKGLIPYKSNSINHYVICDCCCELLSFSVAHNSYGGFFKYSYLCPQSRYVSNIFSTGYELDYKLKCIDYSNILFGFGVLLYTSLYYEEEDRQDLFMKYTCFSMLNPFSYRYFARTYISIGCRLHSLYISYKLIDCDYLFCILPFVNIFKNIVISRIENDINTRKYIPLMLDNSLMISLDILDLFDYLKNNSGSFNTIGDW